jgi:chorismate mutase
MTIDALRRRIDEIDAALVHLLNERAGCALAIGELKRAGGLPIYQPDREAEVFRRVRQADAEMGGPLGGDAIGRLFERIIDEARRIERVGAREGGPEGPPGA